VIRPAQLLVDERYRRWVLKQVNDPMAKAAITSLLQRSRALASAVISSNRR
jgi:hypothetical protein